MRWLQVMVCKVNNNRILHIMMTKKRKYAIHRIFTQVNFIVPTCSTHYYIPLINQEWGHYREIPDWGQCIDRAIKAEQTRLISHLSFGLFIIELSLQSIKTNNTLQLLLQQICLSRVVSNVTNNESKLWKTFSIKPHNHNPNNNCVSVNFFHLCLLVYLPCYLYLVLMFWAVVFMVDPIRW